MRKLALVLILLCICTGAHAAQQEEPKEPFGAHFQQVPDVWFIDMRAKLLEDDKQLIISIVEKVRAKVAQPSIAQLAWVSQFVNLAKVGICAPTAIIELEVLRQLGFADDDLRLVEGPEDFAKSRHAVAAVRIKGEWWVFEDRHLIADYRALPDKLIKLSFRAEASFRY